MRRSIAVIFALAGLLAPDAAAAGPPSGSVLAHQKISDTEGGFAGSLDDDDSFGAAIAGGVDLDGDGVADIAASAVLDDDGGTPPQAERGAIWLLFLDGDGTVRAHQKISGAEGGFTGALDDGDQFGSSLSWLGDLDGDGVPDLAAGAQGDDDGGLDFGAVWILFMTHGGAVKTHQKISAAEGGFTGAIGTRDLFGAARAALGDLDGDGTGDLAVGAYSDDDGGLNRGAVWILFLHGDGTVKSHQKISQTEGSFGGGLGNGDLFGRSLARIGDLDGDGVTDLAAGAESTDDGGADRGAAWILLLESTGTVRDERKISATAGGFTGALDDLDNFGCAVAVPGDLDGDGVVDLAVGAYRDDDGGDGAMDRGAAWILFLAADGTVREHRKISATEGAFAGALDPGDRFGWSLAALGDVNGDARADLASGAVLDDDGGAAPDADRGAVWVLFLAGTRACPTDLDGDGTVGFGDLLVLLASWGPCAPCAADLDGDGAVTFADLLIMLASWGECSAAA